MRCSRCWWKSCSVIFRLGRDSGSGHPSGVGDSPSLCPVRTCGGNCAPRGSVQSGLILRVQIDACTGGGPRVSDLEWEDESDGRARAFDDVNFSSVRPWSRLA